MHTTYVTRKNVDGFFIQTIDKEPVKTISRELIKTVHMKRMESLLRQIIPYVPFYDVMRTNVKFSSKKFDVYSVQFDIDH